jgi:hypothetical protein
MLSSISCVSCEFQVRKRPGMEKVPLLDSIGSRSTAAVGGGSKKTAAGLWAAMSSKLFGGSSGGRAGDNITDACVNGALVSNGASCTIVDGERPTYHVFSLASGHLYERFLKVHSGAWLIGGRP